MKQFVITVAGVTHKDLLLNTAITLPVLQVNIELTRFFLFAPIVLVLLHLGVVGQLVLLARKTLEFASSIRMLEISDQRTHPLRLELDNFFFVQAMAGPERSRVVSTFLHGMSWLTLVALPLAMLLYIQIVFLPYHDVGITWVHRVAVLADIALLLCIGVFLTRSEISFFRAFWRTSLHHPLGLLVTATLLVVVACFSLFMVTIPGEGVDRLAMTSSTERSAIERGGRYVFSYAVPAASVGDSVSETNADTAIVTVTVMANSRNSRPTMPPINNRGMNTATSEMLIDRMVNPISDAPFNAASRGAMPASMCR